MGALQEGAYAALGTRRFPARGGPRPARTGSSIAFEATHDDLTRRVEALAASFEGEPS